MYDRYKWKNHKSIRPIKSIFNKLYTSIYGIYNNIIININNYLINYYNKKIKKSLVFLIVFLMPFLTLSNRVFADSDNLHTSGLNIYYIEQRTKTNQIPINYTYTDHGTTYLKELEYYVLYMTSKSANSIGSFIYDLNSYYLIDKSLNHKQENFWKDDNVVSTLQSGTGYTRSELLVNNYTYSLKDNDGNTLGYVTGRLYGLFSNRAVDTNSGTENVSTYLNEYQLEYYIQPCYNEVQELSNVGRLLFNSTNTPTSHLLSMMNSSYAQIVDTNMSIIGQWIKWDNNFSPYIKFKETTYNTSNLSNYRYEGYMSLSGKLVNDNQSYIGYKNYISLNADNLSVEFPNTINVNGIDNVNLTLDDILDAIENLDLNIEIDPSSTITIDIDNIDDILLKITQIYNQDSAYYSDVLDKIDEIIDKLESLDFDIDFNIDTDKETEINIDIDDFNTYNNEIDLFSNNVISMFNNLWDGLNFNLNENPIKLDGGINNAVSLSKNMFSDIIGTNSKLGTALGIIVLIVIGSLLI